ncbi:DNA-binding XRE family transcriptional regulator [Sedimentibacter acidaminivorans]|uniref:DNA-binding XRE family transcriptional regulator n=1 Tax=Sedimentibacter acidaminivorans TaxID=913099 RepID=A0ABS4GDT3_9FIRM|nr:DNA-binding XRE family transcriptional regulator [Sedimentibacter acidaminivorans]
MKNIMLKIEEAKEIIDKRYDLRLGDLVEIMNNSNGDFDSILNGFRIGYLQGIKAEKARRKNVKQTVKLTVKLKELRGDKTQEEIAKDLGISIKALAAYENAERVPRDEIKLKIANYYNTSIQSIFSASNTIL